MSKKKQVLLMGYSADVFMVDTLSHMFFNVSVSPGSVDPDFVKYGPDGHEDEGFDIVIFDAGKFGGLIDDFTRVRQTFDRIVTNQPDAKVYVSSIHSKEKLALDGEYTHLRSSSDDPILTALKHAGCTPA